MPFKFDNDFIGRRDDRKKTNAEKYGFARNLKNARKRIQRYMSVFVILLENEYWARKSLVRQCKLLPRVEVVGEFEEAEQAMDFIRKRHIDAAIIDILLPHCSGFEIGKEMKEIQPDLNLIFTSGDDTLETQIQKYGGNSFLHKPIAIRDLRCALKQENNRDGSGLSPDE